MMPERPGPESPHPHLPRPLTAPAGRCAEAIRPILRRALELHGMASRLERRLPLHVWDAAVGAEIASRARPTTLRAGELHILVQDHRWRDQLDAARALIIARLNERLGFQAVRALRFALAHE